MLPTTNVRRIFEIRFPEYYGVILREVFENGHSVLGRFDLVEDALYKLESLTGYTQRAINQVYEDSTVLYDTRYSNFLKETVYYEVLILVFDVVSLEAQ